MRDLTESIAIKKAQYEAGKTVAATDKLLGYSSPQSYPGTGAAFRAGYNIGWLQGMDYVTGSVFLVG